MVLFLGVSISEYFSCLTCLTQKCKHDNMNKEHKNQNSTSIENTGTKEQFLLSEETVTALVNLGDVLRRINIRARREGHEIDIEKAIRDHENGDCQN